MNPHDEHAPAPIHTHCCPCHVHGAEGIERRDFLKLGGLALAGTALTGLTWDAVRAADAEIPTAPPRQPLVVKPILMYAVPQRRPQTSWRSWGGIETESDAAREKAGIKKEMEKLQSEADFPVKFLPVTGVLSASQLSEAKDLDQADAVIVYGAGGPANILDALVKLGKPIIVFLRHRSGAVSLWYEIIRPRFLHKHTDHLAVKGIDYGDVVVDALDEVLWRLRALCGLKNTVGSRIVAVGGPGGWATPKAPDRARANFKLDIQTVSYADLGELIKQARADAKAVQIARRRAASYLKDAGVKLETNKSFVENAFLLEQIFRGLMAKVGARAMTINSCMSTIMPLSETTACLPLSTLNDDGFLAFCESDFVVIPAGILLANVSGKPPFLNNPTYPHQGVITQAHCTGPRRMDGKTLDPVRLLTHFESDYGVAPKVEMRKGQKVTNIISDFNAEHWTGFVGEIADAPFLPICRCQIEVSYKFPDARLAENMPGFHWMTCYGDYVRELGYALKRIPIIWENLG